MSNVENVTELTAEIVAAYVANNSVQVANLSGLISSVHAAVAGLGTPVALPPPEPAVNPKRSVHADHITCLENGRRFKSLKRHLMTHHGLTVDEYRSKWSLPADYPMVAPNYGAARSELAKKMGLGRKPKAAPAKTPTRKVAAKANQGSTEKVKGSGKSR